MVLDKILRFLNKDEIKEEDMSQKAKASPFILSTSFRPIRINARKDNQIDLIIKIKNKTAQEQLCSVVVYVPTELGLDSMTLSKSKEFRLGNLKSGEEKELIVPIYANTQTPPANYRLIVAANAHYRDYNHIINSARKKIELRAV